MKDSTDQKIFIANNILGNHNWPFLHPYMKGYEVNMIIDRHNAGTLSDEFVNDFFIRNFYSLDRTLSFIDGFFKRSVHFEPFSYYIENSLVLCFQRDYAGAINILIPVIEGILANYLVNEEQKGLEKGRYETIKKALGYLKTKIVKKGEEYFQLHRDTSKPYNIQREDHQLKQERLYYDNWFTAIDRFFKDSLFAQSQNLAVNVDLNRHTILHSLKLKPYDTLENYIKLFNSLRFLIWAFLQSDNKSVLNEIDDETFLIKSLLYEDIIRHADKGLKRKHILLKGYALYPPRNLRKLLNYTSISNDANLKVKFAFFLKRLLIKMENIFE